MEYHPRGPAHRRAKQYILYAGGMVTGGFNITRLKIAEAFQLIARKFGMSYELSFSDHKIRMAVFVSKHLHCLYDLLYRYKAGQFGCDIPLIISIIWTPKAWPKILNQIL